MLRGQARRGEIDGHQFFFSFELKMITGLILKTQVPIQMNPD